jgi:hypothetical protein
MACRSNLKSVVVLLLSFISSQCQTNAKKSSGAFLAESDLLGLNITIPMHRKIRAPHPRKEIEEFLASTHFKAAHLPNIYLVYNDTWRRDHVTPTLMPNVYNFQHTYIAPQRGIAAATATYHSMLAVLAGGPSYFDYPLVRAGYDKIGGLPINILVKKLGYQFHLDTHGSEMDCTQLSEVPAGAKDMQRAYDYLLHFGPRMQMIHECAHGTTLGNSKVLYKLWHPESSYERVADLDQAMVDSLLRRVRQHRSGHHFYMIHTQQLHDPYSWSADTHNLYSPAQLELKKSDRTLMSNGYKNAAMSFDALFGKFIAGLKAANKFDDAFIIVIGDHGESLGESNGGEEAWFHGGRPYAERINVPIIFKFPGDNSPYKKYEAATIAGYDIMPTILDYLGIIDYGQRFYFGKSLFSPEVLSPARTIISTRPNQSRDTYEMALLNDSYKIIVHLQKGRREDILEADEVKVVSITDLDDIPIERNQKFARFGLKKGLPLRGREEFTKVITDDFAEGLRYLFPE